MACDNCKDLTAFWCPVCSDTPPAKHAVCEVCHDATCPCGKVVMRTDAELIDALRACRWILSQQVAAKDAEIARLRACIAEVKELTDTLKLPRAKAYGLVRASLVAIIAKHGVEVAFLLNDKETP